ITLNLVAWPILPGASDYLTKLVPYLGQTRDYANSSLAGWQAYFDIPNALYWPVWLATAMSVAIGMVILLRWRTTDVVLRSVASRDRLLVCVLTLSSLGQQYYAMLLFPLLFLVCLPRSDFHSWPPCLATVLFLIPNSWT